MFSLLRHIASRRYVLSIVDADRYLEHFEYEFMIYIDYCCWIASSVFCNKGNPNPAITRCNCNVGLPQSALSFSRSNIT